MVQPISDYVKVIAPIDEEKIRALMDAEVAKYPCNVLSKLFSIGRRNPSLYALLFVVCTVISLFLSLFVYGEPFRFHVVVNSLWVAMFVISFSFVIVNLFKKEEAEWIIKNSSNLMVEGRFMKDMGIFHEQCPAAYYELQVLQRISSKNTFPLAIAVLFVFINHKGDFVKRGMHFWSATP